VSAPRLSRAAGHGREAAPIRIAHLGLGNFFRAHECWYTEHASDAPAWGIAAFSGRSAASAELNEQQGLYTLVQKSPAGDRLELVSSLSRAHGAAEHDAWLACFESRELAAVTVTVTEAGWVDLTDPDVRAEVDALRRDERAPVLTAPARLVAGAAARRRAGAGPLALVSCDNIPDNGALARRIVLELAELVDRSLAAWIGEHMSTVTTVVDRITPRTSADDVRLVLDATGLDDRCPVVCEPFTEWVLCGSFPAGRPRWEDAGADFVADAIPFERRKLWLLNGAHSLLAYAGSIRGHATVPGAVADETCRTWVEQWWAEASPHLDQPYEELAAYRAKLLERFSNTSMGDRLERIAEDGSEKLPIRIAPVLRAEREAGRMPLGATRVLAAWVCHLRGLGAPVRDARAEEVVPLAAGRLDEAVKRILEWLDPGLGEDGELVAAVLAQCGELSAVTAA